MKIKNWIVPLFLPFLVGLCGSLYADSLAQQSFIEKRLNELYMIRMKEPVRVKNELLEFIAEYSQNTTDEQLATARIMLGYSYAYLSKADSAKVALDQARKLMAEDFSLHTKFDFYTSFGSFHSLVKSYDSATYYYNLATEIANIINKPYYYATVYTNKGNLAEDMGRSKDAFEYYLKALQNFEASNETKSIAVILNNLGVIYQKMGNFDHAFDCFYRAIAINKSIDAIYDMCMNYGNLGILYKESGRLKEAIATYDTATKIAEENGFVLDIARNKLNKGNLFTIVKDFKAAEKNFLESLKLCDENNIEFGKMLNYNALSDLYLKMGTLGKAEIYAKKALEFSKGFDEIEVLRESNLKLSTIYEKKSLFESALMYRKAYEAANDSMIARAHKNLIVELQARYDSEKKELENVSLKAENIVKEQAIRDQKTINIIISIAVVLLTLLLIFAFRVSNKLKKANQNLNVLYQKIARQNTLLEETIKTKDKLFSIIGHDLRSPFNSMLGFLQLIIDEKEKLEPKELELILNQLYHKSNDTYTLVENLLQWAMNQRGQIAFKPNQHNLFDIVDEELRFLHSRADKKQILLINELPENISAWCDHDMMSTVFRNIINNAIKFTPIKGFVKITAEIKSDYVFVKISDNGVGMDDEMIKRIQHKNEFYSAKGTENETGTGLGLEIVKEFLTSNKALFAISSILGEGTDFVIRLNRK